MSQALGQLVRVVCVDVRVRIPCKAKKKRTSPNEYKNYTKGPGYNKFLSIPCFADDCLYIDEIPPLTKKLEL